ncbi:DUF2891 family protein [Propionibacteriaceae bacterium Y1700]|uniref:DUF2891 family protein n=1 Tax=Microlunatus sp. Y1700 TaxID=3418487 RepID=UPI003DA7839C
MPTSPDPSPDTQRQSVHSAWGRTVLRVLGTRFPYGAAHSSRSEHDVDVTPHLLHPAFWGSLDWHSSVHMQWSAIRLLSAGVDREVGDELRAELDVRLTPEAIAAEADYLRERRSFERPYGWGWLIMLAAEAHRTQPQGWGLALRPLVEVVRNNLLAWLPKVSRPVRHGVHSNTAFALSLCHQGFSLLGDDEAVDAVVRGAGAFFGADVGLQTTFEPSGEDFLSPALSEADLMRRVLPETEFGPWLHALLPDLGSADDPLLIMPEVLDVTDGRSVHLYGLALSRAAHLRSLAPWLPDDRAARVREAADRFVADVADAITHGDFMSTHWLVSFALLAEDAAAE